MPDNEEFNPARSVYTPSEVSAYGVEAIKRVRDSRERALSLAIPMIEDYFAPLRPGQVAGIVGQTSHYKSGLLHYLEHCAARQLIDQKREGEIIIHVSLEEGVEEQAFLEFARLGKEDSGKLANGHVDDWDALLSVAYLVERIPIFRVGDSLGRSEDIPKLYLSNVITAIQHIRAITKAKIALIALDYLQALPPDPTIRRMDYDTQRRLQVRMDAYRLREVASMFSCPVWVAVQAKQTLGDQGESRGPVLRIPGMYDINESADVAQRFDRLLGLWLPARTYPVGTVLKLGHESMTVTENLLFVKVNKQRGGLPAGRTFICTVDFRGNEIKPYAFRE